MLPTEYNLTGNSFPSSLVGHLCVGTSVQQGETQCEACCRHIGEMLILSCHCESDMP